MFPAAYSSNSSGFSAAFAGALQYTGGTQFAGPTPGPGAFTLQGMQQNPLQAMMTLQVLMQATQVLSASWAAFLGGAPQAQAGQFAQAVAFAGAGAFPGAFSGAGAFAGAGAFGGAGTLAGTLPFGGGGASGGVFSGAGGYSGLPGFPAGYSQAAYGGNQAYGGQALDQASLALALNFGYQQLPGESQKMWDVWFDSKAGQQTVQRSPLVLDLNKNGKADITGKNITGDGKIDGPTTMFDLDPNSTSYEFKSQQRRPGSGAPAVDGGHWVDAQGNRVDKGPPKGTQTKFNGYRYLDKDGNTVGEMKDGLYNYGKQEKREVTEWLAKDGGDGFLVADLNGDGEINSAVELFGTEGANGQKYQNGYEKLAALFDKNHDGQVAGDELKGLQIWADKNADGKVQQGEMQSLAEHDITRFDVANYDRTSMEGNFGSGGQLVPYLNLAASLAAQGYGQYLYSNPQQAYFPYQPYARPPFAGYF